jgi:septal ring factor EnvC (AmiA/AmiB activator)
MQTQTKLEVIYDALFKAGHPGTSDAEAEAAANYGVHKLRELYENGLFTDTVEWPANSVVTTVKRDVLCDVATARVARLEGEITKLKGSLKEARKERDAAKDQIAAVKAKVTKKAANSETPYAVLSAKISELEDRLSTEVVNRIKAERENAALKGQPDPYRFIEKHEISKLKKQLADDLVTRTKLEAEIGELNAEIVALKSVPHA